MKDLRPQRGAGVQDPGGVEGEKDSEKCVQCARRGKGGEGSGKKERTLAYFGYGKKGGKTSGVY